MIHIRSILIALIFILFTACGTNENVDNQNKPFKGKRPLNITQFNDAIKSITPERIVEVDDALMMASIPQIEILFQDDKLTSEELVKYYLWRIKRYDLDKLNSVTELNPDALKIAKQFDKERKIGKIRSPLHGTAVLLKDIIGTADKMHNTAGAAALRDAKSNRDAFIVEQLRNAGVVILGKTALSEWSGFMSLKTASGYSALGGQVINPYNKETDPGGSSTGSAVAVVGNFATFAIGVESLGSLIVPAVINGCVTLKPSLGLVSRTGIIPQLDSQDAAGPMARNIMDIALIMDIIVATDQNDPTTTLADTIQKHFTQELNLQGLRGLRIGVLPNDVSEYESIHNEILKALKTEGAQVINLPKQPRIALNVMAKLDPAYAYCAKNRIEKYLTETNAPMKTIKEIVDYNEQDPNNRAKYGQEYLQMSVDSTMTEHEYFVLTQGERENSRKSINELMEKFQLDIIAGTQFTPFFTILYSVAGYPAIVVQGGYGPDGSPVGFVLIGRMLDDAKLINVGYTLEQRLKIWHPPHLN